MANKFVFALLLLTSLGNSCCSYFPVKHLGRKDYVQWINDPSNGLSKSKVVGDIKFTLRYKPVDYIVLNEVLANTITSGGFDSLKRKYDGLQYFEMTIDPSTGNENILKYQTNSASDYNENLNYYSFKMREDIKLIDGDSILPCVLFNFDNSHDLSKHSTAVFAFERSSLNTLTDKVIKYDATRLGIGFVKIEIDRKSVV